MKAADLTPEARLKYKLSRIEWMDACERAGLCAHGCKRPRVEGQTLCAECRKRNADRMREYHRRSRNERHARPNHLCGVCRVEGHHKQRCPQLAGTQGCPPPKRKDARE